MKTAYLDAFSGLSGDMIVAALIDAGAEFDALKRVISSMGLQGYQLSVRRRNFSGIEAMKFDVEVTAPQPERHFGEIRRLIESAGLKQRVTERAIAAFAVLADAEAKIHRTSPEEVHFHEVGAVDSIIDIVGIAWALDELEVDDLIVSALPMGAGFVKSRHGTLPVPAPATLELLSGFTIRMNDGVAEMVTPTGAAIVKALGRSAPANMQFVTERIGYGAGSREMPDRPNVLRAMIGRETVVYATDELIEIEANIDDLNPQIYDHLTMRLLDAGARDVAITPTIMKKGRPGVIVSILADGRIRDDLAAIMFAETSTIGLRFHQVGRLKLDRRVIEVATRFGPIRVKLSGPAEAPITLSPEYDDCRAAASVHKVPLRTIIEEARVAAVAALNRD